MSLNNKRKYKLHAIPCSMCCPKNNYKLHAIPCSMCCPPPESLTTNVHAFIVNFTTTGLIPQGTGIPLDTNLILTSGITHTPGSSVINIEAGTYWVEYTTKSSAPTANFVSTRALLNGSSIVGATVVSPQVAPGTFQTLSSGFLVVAPNLVNTLEIAADSQGGNIYNSQFTSIPNVSVRIVKVS